MPQASQNLLSTCKGNLTDEVLCLITWTWTQAPRCYASYRTGGHCTWEMFSKLSLAISHIRWFSGKSQQQILLFWKSPCSLWSSFVWPWNWSLVCSGCTQNQGAMFLEETSSYCSVWLVLTPLCRKLREEE